MRHSAKRRLMRNSLKRGNVLLGMGTSSLLLVVACNGDDGASTDAPEPTVSPSSVAPTVLPDPDLFQPPASGGMGQAPNPNTVIDANPAGCTGEGETFPGEELRSCYRVVTNVTLPWAQASIDCTLWSAGTGHLVSVTSAAEAEYVRRIANGATVWLGASDAKAEGQWRWTSGEVWFFQDFAADRPDNQGKSEHCLSLTGNGQWDDQPCSVRLGYICERQFAP